MRHLVRDDVVDDRFGRKNEPPAEREITPAGAAPPSALRIAYADPRQLASDPRREGPRPVGEFGARHSDEVITDAALDMRGIAAHPDLSVTDRHRRSRRVVLAPDTMGDAEHRYDDPLGEPHRLREGCEAGGDPSLLGGEKPQTMTRRHAGGRTSSTLRSAASIRRAIRRARGLTRIDTRGSEVVRRHRLPSDISECHSLPNPP